MNNENRNRDRMFGEGGSKAERAMQQARAAAKLLHNEAELEAKQGFGDWPGSTGPQHRAISEAY